MGRKKIHFMPKELREGEIKAVGPAYHGVFKEGECKTSGGVSFLRRKKKRENRTDKNGGKKFSEDVNRGKKKK